MKKQNRLLDPIHPGEILLQEFMKPLGISINRLARDLHVPPNRISGIVNSARAITADTALRLGTYFGVSPEIWLNLQVITSCAWSNASTGPFNDGRDVTSEWLAAAVFEIVDHFGAASNETQKLEGHRRRGGVLYRDNLVRLVVDVPDSAEPALDETIQGPLQDSP